MAGAACLQAANDSGCIKKQKLEISVGKVTVSDLKKSHGDCSESLIFLASDFPHVFRQPEPIADSRLPDVIYGSCKFETGDQFKKRGRSGLIQVP